MIHYYWNTSNLQPVLQTVGDVYVSAANTSSFATGGLDPQSYSVSSQDKLTAAITYYVSPYANFSTLVAALFGLYVDGGAIMTTPVDAMSDTALSTASNYDAALIAARNGYIDYYAATKGMSRDAAILELSGANVVAPAMMIAYIGGNSSYIRKFLLDEIQTRVNACIQEIQRRVSAGTNTGTSTEPTTAPAPVSAENWLAIVAVKRDTWRSALSAARDLELRASIMLEALGPVMASYQVDQKRYAQEIATLRGMMDTVGKNIDFARQLSAVLAVNIQVADQIIATGDVTATLPPDPSIPAPPPLPDVVPYPAPVTGPSGAPVSLPARSLDAKPVPMLQPEPQPAKKSGAGMLVGIGLLLSLFN